MSNLTQETLASLLSGKLAFKIFNVDTNTWELVKLDNPDLVAHTGAKASLEQEGHVQLTNALESDSETLAPTAKSLSTVFSSINSHVNEEGIHLTTEQKEKLEIFSYMLDRYNDILLRLDNIEKTLIDSDQITGSLTGEYSVEEQTEPVEEQTEQE